MQISSPAPALTQTLGAGSLYKLIAVLVTLWLAGLAMLIMLGGLIHLLLIIAVFVFAVEFMTEKDG